MTMTLIGAVAVGSGGAANITFNSIPATYTDLQLVLSLRSASGSNLGNTGLNMSINASTANRTQRRIYGSNGSIGSDSSTNARIMSTLPTSTSTSNAFGTLNIYFPNYAGSTNKSFFLENGADQNSTTSYELEIVTGLWANTAAITTLSISMEDSSNFVQYSTATLYGITKGSGGATVS